MFFENSFPDNSPKGASQHHRQKESHWIGGTQWLIRRESSRLRIGGARAETFVLNKTWPQRTWIADSNPHLQCAYVRRNNKKIQKTPGIQTADPQPTSTCNAGCNSLSPLWDLSGQFSTSLTLTTTTTAATTTAAITTTATITTTMPTHNLHSRMSNFFHQSEEIRMNRAQCESGSRPANTLQSVLRGEIPSEYLHLTSLNEEQRRHILSTGSDIMSTGSDIIGDQHNHHHDHQVTIEMRQQQEQFCAALRSAGGGFEKLSHTSIPQSQRDSEFHDVTHRRGASPCRQSRLSPYRRPGAVPAGFRLQQEDASPDQHHHQHQHQHQQYYDRHSPIYHSNRSSPFYEPGSPYGGRLSSSPHYAHHASPVRPHSPLALSSSSSSYSPSYLAPSSPISAQSTALHNAGDSAVFNKDEQPIDLSCKPETKFLTNASRPPTPELVVLSSIQENPETLSYGGSMLRNLLSFGKNEAATGASVPPGGASSDRDSPCSDVMRPEVPLTGSTPVTLAKKMIHPITSRVSDWLVKIVQFSKSIPEFSNLSDGDKLTLLSSAWARILVLFMAENEFEFAVTPLHSSEGGRVPPEGASVDECPTMRSVEAIQSLIRKCKNMNLDKKEYALLRMSVLFNNGHVGLENPEMVEKLNAAVQQLLQQHVTTTRPEDAMHYSRILMCLPTLYGINCKVIETLFCSGIHPNMNIDVLLLEMLRNL